MPGKSRFGAARQAAHIHIQQLKTGLGVMTKALAVLLIDLIQCLLQLRHVFCAAGIQGFLHHRLFSTRASAKGGSRKARSARRRVLISTSP